MKLLINVLILSLLSIHSWAKDLEAQLDKKLEADYKPITKACSQEAQDRLGELVELDDSRCSGMDLKYCGITLQYPIGFYKMYFENGACEVQVTGTSIRKYQNTVTCEDSQGESLCDEQYEWAKPEVTLAPTALMRLMRLR